MILRHLGAWAEARTPETSIDASTGEVTDTSVAFKVKLAKASTDMAPEISSIVRQKVKSFNKDDAHFLSATKLSLNDVITYRGNDYTVISVESVEPAVYWLLVRRIECST